MSLEKYTECPNCKEQYEGANIFKCRCGKIFCNFCDFGSRAETRCPACTVIVKNEVGVIELNKK